MINTWKASRGCESLTRYTQPTSKSAYKELIDSGVLNTQLKKLLAEYDCHPEGLTDVQASRLLFVDASTLSARRNDLTKRYGSHVLIRTGVRNNGEGRRSGIVWVLNPNLISER